MTAVDDYNADILIEDGKIAPYRKSGATFVAMGRFGNVPLIGGEFMPHLDEGALWVRATMPSGHRSTS